MLEFLRPLPVLLLLLAGLQPCLCLRVSNSRADFNLTFSIKAAEPHRYIFVAGTPGTGLDFWSLILRECVNQNVCEARDPSFYTTLEYQQGVEADFRKNWGRQRPTSGKLIPMNTISPKPDRLPDGSFLHAYLGEAAPNNDDPQLPLYARVAAHYGDRFKVLVMTRQNAQDLLAYRIRTLNMPTAKAENTTAENLLTLANQLRQLPKGTYRCQRLEDLVGLGEKLGPLMGKRNEQIHEFARYAFASAIKISQGVSACKKKRKCPPSSKVQKALDELEGLCKPEDLGPPKNLTLAEMRLQDAFYESKARWIVE